MRVSPTTATSAFVSGFHNVTTVSAAIAKTEPSPENVAAVIGLFLHDGQFYSVQLTTQVIMPKEINDLADFKGKARKYKKI